MRDYRIIKVRVRVRYDDGKPGWFEAELSPDCRNVVIGLDAVGIAGSYDPPTRPRLLEPINEQDFDGPMGMADQGEARQAAEVRDEPRLQVAGVTKTMSAATSTTALAAETPDICEYINGRWYCWTSVT